MDRRWLGVTFVVLVIVGTACTQVSGSGNVVTRQIDAGPFSELDVSHGFTVNVTVGSPEKVTVRVDNLVDLLDVAVSGDTLRVGLESGTDASDATLEADITVSSLTTLGSSGASTISLVDPLGGTLAVTLSGASQVTGPIQIEGGTLEMSGASGANLTGTATMFDATLSGASRLTGTGLSIGDLMIDLSGASNAEVTVTGSLSATASGASTLRYAGSPTVARSEGSDASTIEPIG
jgi:Putative auto-transporter adhesin, head GIN domain